jgi:ribosomal protein L29
MAPKKKTTSAASVHKSLADLKSLDKAELQTELASARKEQYVLTMKKELGELKQSHLMKSGRKYIAQISTCLSTAL